MRQRIERVIEFRELVGREFERLYRARNQWLTKHLQTGNSGKSYFLLQPRRHAAHIHESIDNPVHNVLMGCNFTRREKTIPPCDLFSVGVLYLFHRGEEFGHRDLLHPNLGQKPRS